MSIGSSKPPFREYNLRMYTETFLVSSNDVDPFLDLSIPSLFRFLQAIATTGVAAIGAGKEETTDKGFMWVLTRMSVHINKLPRYMDEMSLTTYPGEQLGCFYFRHFYATSKEGEEFFRVSSSWALLNEKDRKPLMRCPFPHPIKPEKDPDELPRPEKLFSPESAEEKEKRRITYSMCDLNGHLNNTRYLELIVDTKGRDFYRDYAAQEITLNFEKEIQEGEEVSLFVSEPNEKMFLVVGKVCGEERFIARLSFQEKAK